MELFSFPVLILLALLFLSTPILVLILFVSNSHIKKRLRFLEKSIRELKEKGMAVSKKSIKEISLQKEPGELVSEKEAVQKETTVSGAPSLNSGAEENLWSKFIDWFKEDWMLKIGGLILIAGFGWLVSYAFIHNWIGPTGRILLGILGGVAILMLGWVRMKKYFNQGSFLLVVGAATVLLTIFAARKLYNFFTPLSALAMMFLTTAFIGFVSVKYKKESLAILGLILAGIAPFFVDAPKSDFVSLFAYLLIVSLGLVWVSFLLKSRRLSVGLLFLSGYYTFLSFGRGNYTVLALVFAFSFIIFITNLISIVRENKEKVVADILVSLGNVVLLLFWITNVLKTDTEQVLVILVWMFLFLFGSFFLSNHIKDKKPFYIYSIGSLTMLVAATTIQFSGPSLAIAYIVEATLVPIVAYSVVKDVEVLKTSVLVFWPFFCTFRYLALIREMGSFRESVVVLLLFALSLFILGMFFRSKVKVEEKSVVREISSLSKAFIITASLYFYYVFWFLMKDFFYGSLAIAISLVFYLIVGIICYLVGREKSYNILYKYGIALIVFVIFRVVFVDVWGMSLAGRIMTFFIIGIILISTAFLRKKPINLK